MNFSESELYNFVTRFTKNLVNNTIDTGIFEIEDGYKVFYAADIKKALKQTWPGDLK